MATSFQVHHILPVELFNSKFKDDLNDILGNDTTDQTRNTALQSYNNRIALYSDVDRAMMIFIN
jgi:hypothetical protein